MGWVIAGLVFIAIGVVLFFVHRNERQKAFSIRSAELMTTAELSHLSGEIAREIGGGSWRDYVKVTGVIECDRPLISELRQEPCVYYTMTVKREYEESVTEKDSSGKTRTETRRGSEVVASNQQSVPFWLRDPQGAIEVNPDGANIETVKVLDEFRPEQAIGGTISFGQFSRQVGFGDRRRTIGYRYTESILPLQRRIFVLGAVSDSGQQLTLLKPTEAGKRFIISLKSEEELTRSADQSAQNGMYAMIACGAIGVILLVIGILQ
ncbi:E3 ubiquitin ligase family protein [Egbenema bharatensis]|uniref:E3 ubiquitin ligase family protein n=1 Tax=Egbenema bharatensis TaxID=3463334 RepID=UPI003A897EBB